LWIWFPINQYPSLLAPSDDAFEVFAPYPRKVEYIIGTVAGEDRIVKISLTKPVMKNVPFTVSVLNIKNPSKQGGTGNFRIESKVGNFVIDENYNFAVIG